MICESETFKFIQVCDAQKWTVDSAQSTSILGLPPGICVPLPVCDSTARQPNRASPPPKPRPLARITYEMARLIVSNRSGTSPVSSNAGQTPYLARGGISFRGPDLRVFISRRAGSVTLHETELRIRVKLSSAAAKESRVFRKSACASSRSEAVCCN